MQFKSAFFRYTAGLILLISLIFGYWWLTWSLAIVFLFIFPSYYEIVVAGIIYDALYGLALPQFYNFPYVFTVTSLLLFLSAVYLRNKLLVYAQH